MKTMIVSYMLILLLPMTVGLFLYGRVENVMENNVERSNSAMLEQLRLSMDSKLKEFWPNKSCLTRSWLIC
ncbi:hypothetical protein NST44_22690 [Paenibacillus sp. FSL W8-0919]|uniref:hypothetical protein n=1 Tax=Paenibacillus sp. FSL W8-0919 TaxID=2954707 RepID=UPI0030F76A79